MWQVLCNTPRKLRNFILFIGAALIYAVGRYLLLALLYLDLPVFSLFWNKWVLCFSHLPLAALLCWSNGFCAEFISRQEYLPEFRPKPAEGGPRKVFSRFPKISTCLGLLRQLDLSRKQALGGLGMTAAAFCFVVAWGWEDPGEMKKGRLIIDETHSQWELMNRKYRYRMVRRGIRLQLLLPGEIPRILLSSSAQYLKDHSCTAGRSRYPCPQNSHVTFLARGNRGDRGICPPVAGCCSLVIIRTSSARALI